MIQDKNSVIEESMVAHSSRLFFAEIGMPTKLATSKSATEKGRKSSSLNYSTSQMNKCKVVEY